MNRNTGWRTLAEPTYGVRESGLAELVPAGTRLKLMDRIPEMVAIAGADMALERTGPDGAAAWYVTASALRFEGDEVETGVPERPAHFESFDEAGDDEEPYASCSGCGAEVYADGTHVLDGHDRASNGYLPCPPERGPR